MPSLFDWTPATVKMNVSEIHHGTLRMYSKLVLYFISSDVGSRAKTMQGINGFYTTKMSDCCLERQMIPFLFCCVSYKLGIFSSRLEIPGTKRLYIF